MRAYASLMKNSTARRLIAATATGKFGYATFPLAMVLLGHGPSGSFVDAGLAAAAWNIGGTVTAPFRGQVVDRYGHRLPLTAFFLVTAIAMAGLTTVSDIFPLVAFGALAGASAPPIMASVRPLWTHVVDQQLVRTAYALDAVLSELAKVCGPLIAAATAAWSPKLGVATAGALLLIGTFLLIGRPLPETAPRLSTTSAIGAMAATPGLRLLLAVNTATGLCLGALTVGLPARTSENGSAADSGWLFACLAIGSGLAGLWFGARRHQIAPTVGYPIGCLWLTLALASAAFVPVGVPLAVVLVVAGGALAPMTVCQFELLDRHAPRGTAVASMMWMVSGEELGRSVGSIVAGLQTQAVGASLAVSTAAASAGIGAIVLSVRRGSLESATGSPTA
ncbi:MFS transporter [Streptomyces sp. OE57]|uniref:MFS transporter n=1 Tax=Streptomyces lacaronensis TaxID=3379885 RepID=UPI0039B77568